MTQEKPCDSEDTPCLKVVEPRVGWRFPTCYSQEEVDAFNYKYLSEGWTPVASIATLGFISPDGSWYRGIDAATRAYINMPLGHARRLGFCGPYKKESDETHETEVPR
jgi:hypothetical protein